MNAPMQNDPEVLEKLYRRFSHLAGQPLKLCGLVGDAPPIGTLETDELLAFIVANGDETTPYRPDFPFLSIEENASLKHYVQVQPLEPCPQPRLNIVWGGSEKAGVLSSTKPVDVLMRPIGYAQLWYGDESGVLWDTGFRADVVARVVHNTLLHGLWSLCENFLEEKGVKHFRTYSYDPAYVDLYYSTFLQQRGYRPDPARNHLPGGRLAAVKHLGARKGSENA